VGGPAELEEEAEQQGAFNEETGEINWDCPCLGGMAHGPCGEQFRAAFSCFVYSKEEPKGVDCIEHFKTMQNCFREHPDIYGAELDDDEVAEVQAEEDRAQASIAQSKEAQATGSSAAVAQASRPDGPGQVEKPSSQDKRSAEHQSETSELVPKAWHDGRESKTEK
jgi:intermembrane space import and assembly protein 40